VEAAPHPLPESVTGAPKRGFTLPFEQWMRGPLAEPITTGLADLARDGWITTQGAHDVWRDWQAGQAHWSRAWSLGVLGQFLRHG
jgi:asparagine synthase (glutamine-hydrolysing)